MKIVFNELGAVIERITTDEALRQGNVGNTITATFNGKDNLNYEATLNFTRPDGKTIADVVMKPSTTTATDFSLVFNNQFYFAIAGATTITIFLRDSHKNVVAEGQIQFVIEANDFVLDDPTITRDEYNELLALIAGKMPLAENVIVLEQGQERPEIGERNTIYFVPRVGEKEVYDRYYWNALLQDYQYLGDTTINLSEYQRLSEKGKANGYTPLDKYAHIPLKFIPGMTAERVYGTYVNETTFNDENGQPIVGESDKLYIDNETNIVYGFNPNSGKFFIETSGTIYAENVKYTPQTENGLEANEVQGAIDELNTKKVNVKPLVWTALPEGAVDKKTFYKKVNEVLKTANNKIYMWQEPDKTPIKEFFDIWGKPTDFKATHVYITIASISNVSSRDSFIMIIHSSNYSNMYYYVVNGYAGQLVGNGSGWISFNLLNAERQRQLLLAGFYDETATCGKSLGLIDPNPAEPIEGSFITRTTANGQGVYDDTATIVEKIGGNTIVANQLVNQLVDTFTDKDTGITITNLGNNKLRLSGTSTNTSESVITLNDENNRWSYKKGDSYLFATNQNKTIPQGAEVSFGYLKRLSGNEKSIIYARDTEVTTLRSLYLFIQPNTIFDDVEIELQVVNLTTWYQTNVPTTIEDIKVQWVKHYLENHPEYNEGSLVNVSPILKLTSKTSLGVELDTLNADVSTYFPEGMNGVNSVHDSIEKFNKKAKAIKRFGVVDLGSDVVYGSPDSDKRTLLLLQGKAKGNPDNTKKSNIICPFYKVRDDAYYGYYKNFISMAPDGTIHIGNDAFINQSNTKVKEMLSGVYLVYELKTPIETPITEPLDLSYNVQNQGIEEWTSDVPIYTSAVYKRDLVYDLSTLPTRVAELERDMAHYSLDIVNLHNDKADKDSVMAKYRYRGNVYDIDLYNQLLSVDEIMQGAMFSIEITNDTPIEKIRQGYPNLKQGAIVYGWLSTDELGQPMIINTEQGNYKITDGGTLTCEKISGLMITNVNYSVIDDMQIQLDQTTINDYYKGLKVSLDVDVDGIIVSTTKTIEFNPKSTATIYVGGQIIDERRSAKPIFIRYVKATGIVDVYSENNIPRGSYKIIDVKGLI